MKLRKLAVVTTGVLVVTSVAGFVSSTPASADDAGCSNATLKGRYLFAYNGFSIDKRGRRPATYAGQEIYDGQGSGTGVNSFSINGEISRYVRYTFTYTVNPDCTGDATFNQEGEISHYDTFVAPSGDQFVFIHTDPGFVEAGSEPRVARRVD
jgi:hypothetical protein